MPISRGFLRYTLSALLTAALLHAEEPFSFERAPGRLPKDIVPRHYKIHIEPNIAAGTIHGRETISLEIRQTAYRITLNSFGNRIEKVSLRTPTGAILEANWETEEANQTLDVLLKEPLSPGAYELSLEWSGKLGEQPEGLFITRYQAGAAEKCALATHMEPADARRMFPCWDEPAFRAEFELSAVIPKTHLAVSNMPVVKELAIDDTRKEVQFDSTPAMASYLVAFCSGEFEQLQDEIEGIHLRVITTEGKIAQARYALEITKKLLPFYNNYFGIRYPLPKLDQFCFPGFPAGGMENWGAIFYVDTAMLFDPEKSAQATKERVFGVVAHEIAHQWFGDLVTMGWWDNLWLNEGFASWMGTKASDHFNPEWQIWLRAAARTETAMALDARSTTHPIQQPVRDEHQASDAFDEITYAKGQSFLRMLESYLGEDIFREGIRRYLSKHAYGNTTTADLWTALEEASGKLISPLAAGWTEQPGFPLVQMQLTREAGSGTLRISQERFTLYQKEPAPLHWQIPLSLAPISDLNHPTRELIGADPLEVKVMGRDEPVKGNAGGKGYYRVSYNEQNFDGLTAHFSDLPEADRLNLLNDGWALVEAKRLATSTYFNMLAKIAPEERSYAVWTALLRVLWFIDALELEEPGRGEFHAWARRLLHARFEELGWNGRPGESPLASDLRSQVINALGAWGDTQIAAESAARYATYRDHPESLSGDLRGTVLYLVGRTADATTYEEMHRLAQLESSTEIKEQLYGGLAASLDPELARRTLAIALSNELPPRWATGLVSRVALSGEQSALAWTFAQAHLEALLAKLSSNGADHYVPGLFRNFSDAARADELELFKHNLPPQAAYAVSKAANEIRFKSDLKQWLLPAVDSWILRRHHPEPK